MATSGIRRRLGSVARRATTILATTLVLSTLAAMPALAADSPSPEVPSGAPASWGAAAIATTGGNDTGVGHTCAITTDATPNVKCWGDNTDGKLGVNDTNDRPWPTRVTLAGTNPVPVATSANGATIAVGMGHSCVIYNDTGVTGGVQCWGSNDSRELGSSTTGDKFIPTVVPGLTGVVALAIGGPSRTAGYTCAVLTGGTAKCWGYNVDGETGVGNTTSPVTAPTNVKLAPGTNDLANVVGITAGQKHACAIVSPSPGTSRTAYCWGLGNQGRLGDNNINTHTAGTGAVAVVGPGNTAALTDVRMISTGWDHTCYISGTGAGGTAYCWGRTDIGQIGNNVISGSTFYGTPQAVTSSSLGTSVTSISAGWVHTCAATSGGALFCWGENDDGRLGEGNIGTNNNVATPKQVVALGDVDAPRTTLSGVNTATYGAVSAGSLGTCVRSSTSEAICFGSNGQGQLGDGTTTQRNEPIYVNGTGAARWTVAAVGVSKSRNGNGDANHTCVITDTNTDLAGNVDSVPSVKCWGYNSDNGQIGDGSQTNRFQATDVALTTLGGSGAHSPIPRKSQTAGGTLAVADAGTCVIYDAAGTGSNPGITGGVQCWGNGDDGANGDGTLTAANTPRVVQTPTGNGWLSDVVSLDAASYSYNFYETVCAVTSSGAVYCWGFEDSGELGNGTTLTGQQSRPTLAIASGAASVSVGTESSCAVLTDGSAKCWGNGSFGGLGDGTTNANAQTPVTVSGGLTWKSISVGEYTACGVTTGGAARCWGRDNLGQLGDDASLTNKSVPTAVSGLGSGVASISVGGSTACAVLSADGSVKCWGRNDRRGVGDGTTTNRPTPVNVIDFADKAGGANLVGASTATFGSLSAGTNQTCVRTSSGALGCWGFDGGFGDLGNHYRDGVTETYVSCGPEKVALNAPSTCTATVIDRSTWRATAPLGTVAVSSANGGTVSSSPCTLTKLNAFASRCTVTATRATAGTFTVTGTYTPVSSPTHATSTSAASNTVTVAASHSSTTTVSCTPTPLVVGSSTTCTATVSDPNASPFDPDGMVTITGSAVGGTPPTGPVSACALAGGSATTSVCSIALASPNLGTSTITARYTPSTTSANLLTSSSGTTSVTWAAAAGTTTSAVACAPGSVSAGNVSTCTATVTDIGVTPSAPAGTVTVAAGSTAFVIGPSCTLANATSTTRTCSVYVMPQQAGSYTVTVTYVPSDSHSTSSGSGGLTATTATGPTRFSPQVALDQPTLGFGQDLTIDTYGANCPGPSAHAGAYVTFTEGTDTLLAIRDRDAASNGSWQDQVTTEFETPNTYHAFHYCASATPTTPGDPSITYTFPEITATITAGPSGASPSRGNPTVASDADGPRGAITTDPDALPAIDELGIPGTYAAALKRRVDARFEATGAPDVHRDHATNERYVRAAYTELADADAPEATVGRLTAELDAGTARVTVVEDLALALRPAQEWIDLVGPTEPSAPRAVSAIAGRGAATVSWRAPAANGAAISSYKVTPYAGSVPQAARTFTSTATTQVITGLRDDTSYSFEVAAVNAQGASTRSWPSATVTPSRHAPFATWSALVTRQFLDITASAPSSSSLSTWATRLAEGTRTPEQLVDELRRGPENLANVDPVVRIYRAFLGRTPDAAGLRFWITRKRAVAPARTWSVTQIAQEFTRSSEFVAKYGSLTNRQWVTRIYTDVLGRAADTGGVDFWTRQLDTGRKTKAQVMVGFSESSEYKAKQAERTDAVVAYLDLLGRAPTGSELDSWVSRQKAGTAHTTLLGELFDSLAYRQRIIG